MVLLGEGRVNLHKEKINRSHIHTPTENNTPDTDTHAHDKNNTQKKKKYDDGRIIVFTAPSYSYAIHTPWYFSGKSASTYKRRRHQRRETGHTHKHTT